MVCLFQIHSFIFCSLIIPVTTSPSAQDFPEFQKESGLGVMDYRTVTEAVKSLSDCNWSRTHNHLAHKRTLSHLAKLVSLDKWLSVGLRTK